jgi:hypothetical protein
VFERPGDPDGESSATPYLCEEEDLNLHSFRNQNLNRSPLAALRCKQLKCHCLGRRGDAPSASK